MTTLNWSSWGFIQLELVWLNNGDIESAATTATVVIQLSAWSKKIISAFDTIASAGRLCDYDLLQDNKLSLDLILF